MRKLILGAVALATAVPATVAFTTSDAEAQRYRGRDYYYDCRKRGGTTGALLGGAGGAVVGSAVGGTGATIAGGLLGALGGREVERTSKRNKCRKVYR